ncbi:hypothetical protein BGX21_000186 [Mortierella sp. AD011]|nr:hypothetical protein BGX20_001291 [Mortierella sp. AD010]KAF9389082.1 hypothetical protein BGX21_000186 [Mortierella sp. AD011]
MASTAAALLSATSVIQQVQAMDSVHLRTHSINQPYIDQDLQNRWFDFGGDSIVNTNKHIRLTQDEPSQSGWLWSRLPLSAPNYQIEFEFSVGGKGTGLYGDGFAVWLTKERGEVGPVFGNRDKFEGLGIFFDTYANSRQSHSFPYVMAMLGDGKTSYDNDHDGLGNRIGSCESDFRGRNIPTKGRLTYDSVERTVNLKLQVKEWDQWDDCFTLYDIKLPSAYLGFTAHTGEVHDSHDIISVSSTYTIKTDAEKNEKRNNYNNNNYNNNTPPPSKKSGFSWLFKLITASGIFAGIVVIAYKTSKKKNDMKQF